MEEGFFTPESALWRVDRELALLLGGGRALLMQVAHPKIAAGVAEHSRFLSDPLKRLTGTMATMWSIVFDDRPRAEAALGRLENIHRRVRGTVQEPGAPPPGAPYSAGDADLRLWVHATLIDSALVTYDRFVQPLSAGERRRYYEDSKKLGILLGVKEAKLPDSYEEFVEYMAATIQSGALAVGPTARALARAVLHPAPWFLKTVAPLHAFITAGLLPPELRRAYGLSWSGRRERALRFVAGSTRAALPLVPAIIRVVPRARAAEARAG
ncbi:MAG TPA: oxygenase MpaB family protein [Candidatus Binatia bacterium]